MTHSCSKLSLHGEWSIQSSVIGGKSATCVWPCVRQHPSPASSEPLAGPRDPGTPGPRDSGTAGRGPAWPAARAGPGDGVASSRSYRGAPSCCLSASFAAAAPPRILTSGTPRTSTATRRSGAGHRTRQVTTRRNERPSLALLPRASSLSAPTGSANRGSAVVEGHGGTGVSLASTWI
jgi:hypothetical protein